MNVKELIGYLSGKTELSVPFIEALTGLIQTELYKCHQILHAAGQLENRLYLLQSGLLRNYYYDQRGIEHTVKFWETGNILFSYEGYFHVPSYFYTEVIENAEVTTLSYENLHELGKRYAETAQLIRFFLLDYQQSEYTRQQLLLLPVRERYLKLRQTNPVLFQKSPIKFIASYLGMTRETLTRLIGQR